MRFIIAQAFNFRCQSTSYRYKWPNPFQPTVMRKNIILLLLVLGTAVAAQAQVFNNTDISAEAQWRQSRALNDRQFADLLKVVNNTPFADDKKEAFRLGMQKNYITVDQVSVLLKQFTFDDDKLAWAMLAYKYTTDVQKFYQLRDRFSFLTTQDDFDKFLQRATSVNYHTRHNAAVFNRADFAQLKESIRKAPFADDKKKVFRLALQNNYITVSQLSELLKQFNFDDEKIDWATMAYNYTADTERFYQLRDLLVFDSSKQKLDKFLLTAAE